MNIMEGKNPNVYETFINSLEGRKTCWAIVKELPSELAERILQSSCTSDAEKPFLSGERQSFILHYKCLNFYQHAPNPQHYMRHTIMVAEIPDNYPETDQSPYRDLKAVPVVCIMDDEKNHFKNANLSKSCMSGLTLDDSWSSVDQLVEEAASLSTTVHAGDRGPAMPLRGRRSLVLPRRTEEEQNDFSDNRFAAILQQPQQHQRNLCTPPLRRPSSDCSVLSSDSSTAMLSLDLTSAYKSFNDSSVISVATEILEQDPTPAINQNQKCLPLRTQSRGTNKGLVTKTTRRLTPTLEVPEEQDQSNWGENTLDEIPSDHVLVETTTTTAPLRDADSGTTRTTARQTFSRDSITLDADVIKTTMGNHHWGVKSSLTLDSMLFDDSAVGFVEEPEDDYPSKRTSWAVGSSLTFATFEDSLSAIKQSAGHHDAPQYPSQEHAHEHLPKECSNLVSKNDFLCQEMNRLRFSSHGDSMHNTGSGHRTLPSTFSSITPCSKPIRSQSTNTNDSKADSS